MVNLKNNQWINYTDEELKYKKNSINEFLIYKKSLNIDENQLRIDKNKIQNFINSSNKVIKSGIFIINQYYYFVLIDICNTVGIISQVKNINNINIKSGFDYAENYEFIIKLLPGFKKMYNWTYYFNDYIITGTIKKNIFKFNKDTNIYEIK